MGDLFQALLSGLALGGVYALVALGFSITHTTTKTLNFGQGEFLVAGSFIAVATLLLLSGKAHTGVLAAADVTAGRYGLALLVSLVVLGVMGVLLYFTAVRPFLGATGMAYVMSTIGFGIIVQNSALAIWGPASMAMPSPLGDEVIRIAGAGIRPQEILVIAVTGVVMLALDYVLRKTKIGKAVRAVAANKEAAALMGINVTAIVVLAFVVSSALAGLGGLLIAPITTASVFMGLAIALKAFSAAIVGGLTNPRGCIVGGFLLGGIEAFIGLWRAEMREITIFALIILVLVVKPQGLFGQPPFEKV